MKQRLLIAAMLVVPMAASAQRAPSIARTFSMDDRPRLGLSTGSSGKRDSLGLLVTDVVRGGPADKAGIEDGDRLQSINGVNLRLSAIDAGEPDMDGVALRRLTRELAKGKIGDEVELKVYRDGQTKTLKVKTADAEDLQREVVSSGSNRLMARDWEERATLGFSMGATGTRRDTSGILVASVVDDGPADKAKIEEGDRIAAINGVDLRVAREDAGDMSSSSTRMRRFSREMEKVKAGDEVELRVYRAGQTRTVRVKSVASKDLPRRGGGAFYFEGPGGGINLRGLRELEGAMPGVQVFPRGAGTWMELSPSMRGEVEERMRDAMERLRRAVPRSRVESDKADAERAARRTNRASVSGRAA